MRWSQMFIPTLRDAPKDVDRPTAILSRAGYAFASGGKLAALLPLGVACLDKLKRQLTARLSARSAEEIAPLFYQRTDSSSPGIAHMERHNQAGDVPAVTDVDRLLWEIAARHLHSYNQLPRLWFSSVADSCGHGGCFIHCMSLSLCEATRETPADPVQQVFSEATGMLGLPVIRADGFPFLNREEAATEFFCISPDGDVEVAHCPCGYAANLDCAVSKAVGPPDRGQPASGQPRLVETPGMKTIADVSDYLGIPASSLIKSLLYIASGRPLLVLVRGDDQLNEHLLRRALGSYDLRPANTEEIRRALGADPGSIGPVGVPLRILADYSIRPCYDMACGANKDDYHLTAVQPGKDFRAEYVHLRQVHAGDPCPDCGKPLTVSRARLLLRSATLPAQSEELTPLRVLGPDNKPQPLLITAHRVSLHAFLFALVERFSDENGLVLPLAVSPFDVLITPVRYNDPAQKEVCDRAYDLLQGQNLRVLIDDRDVSPGVKFKDADLIGIPLRITIGPKKLSEGKVELRVRATGETFDCPTEDVAQHAMRMLCSAGPTGPPT